MGIFHLSKGDNDSPNQIRKGAIVFTVERQLNGLKQLAAVRADAELIAIVSLPHPS